MTRLSRLRRRRSLRTQLMWLALGPLLVSSILCFQRARSEQANLQHARALSSTALASSALGHLGSFLDYEHTMALGTALVLESGFPMDVVADAMGIDPRDAVVNLATSVDALEPVVTSRLDELGDASVGEVLQSLLAPRRELRAEAAAGALSVARVSAVYGELETFVAEQRAWLTPAIDAEARASGADQALIDALQASDTIGEWSTDLAKQGEMVGLMVVVVPSTPADAKALMGAAMVNGDRAFERLQELPSVRGTNLVEGSAPVSEWARLREALLVELGMTLKGTPSGDALVQTNLTGAYAIATTALLEAAAPVYAAIDADIVRGADTLVRDATRTLYIAAGAGALVSALAILWVILIAKGVTGPLARLGRRAAEVSAGTLSSEPIGPIGPREVASLALAFDEVCGNLRHVERQTEALAAGRLDDEVLADRSPGCLGESLQRSIARVSDLTERLAQQARRDPMTGLPNRAAVIEHLTAVLHRCGRSGEAAAVLFVDLDGFKAINDAYGHGTGDLVLQEIATRFRRVARAGEMVARLGGDEFVLVAEGLHDAMAAVTMGDRLINAAQQQFRIDNATFSLSASVGVAIAEADSTPLGLLGEADQAVYQAKRDGKSRVRLFDDEMQNAMVRRTSLERDLRRALTADEFELYVQPVIDARTGDTWGAEALIRWNRPGHGIVPPVDFIPFAEESWLIVEIGRAVLDKACRLLAEWDRVGCELTLAVNIAGRHLAEGGLVADVRDALARHEVPPGRLSVELTESHLVTDLAHAARVLTELRALGVHVALDDFGTGHSSINYLRQLPIDTMKIDRSYIGEVGANDQANSLLASLMHLARSLRLDVVAEGVETDRQADHLRTIGCPKFQGFLFARPMPAAQFAVWEESHLLPR